MNAIDTNIIVRCLTNDMPDQAKAARALIDREQVFVPLTVVLETEWVLRKSYRMSAEQTVPAIRRFLGLDNIVPEMPGRVDAALDAVARGFDFADALHLAAAEDGDIFFSFDRDLAKAAAHGDGPIVRAP